jgi:class 3 adenylate cyclase
LATKRELPSGLVTFLFTDIEGSTRLAQLLGGQYRPMLNAHRQILRHALGVSDGVAMFTEGDSVFAVFKDANAALRACIEGQRALAAHNWANPETRPKVRMGLHSGNAAPVAGEYATPEVHRAARVAAAAHGGQVLCSAATAHLATACSSCADSMAGTGSSSSPPMGWKPPSPGHAPWRPPRTTCRPRRRASSAAARRRKSCGR